MDKYTNILGIKNLSLSTSSNVDSEHSRIMKMLISYGITPTGNKNDDKARLHRYELEKVEDGLKSIIANDVKASQFITISNAEIEELKQSINPDLEKEKAIEEENKKLAEQRVGENQIAMLNSYFIKKNGQI